MLNKSIPFRLAPFAAALFASGVASAATNIVSSCSDDLSFGGTLRNTIASSKPGDTVDVSHLDPVTCSVITLMTGSTPNGPIVVNQASPGIKIHGPGADKLAISAENTNRVFTHTGAGQLVIDGLTIEKGSINGPYATTPPKGGCIASYSSLYLTNSTVSHCAVYSSGGNVAQGGGIFGVNVELHHSTVTANSAGPYLNGPYAGTAAAVGGGIYVGRGALTLDRSTVSYNSANAPTKAFGSGAGVYAKNANLSVAYSSLLDNGGVNTFSALTLSLSANVASIEASTISKNKGPGLKIIGSGSFLLTNSTVSDNEGMGLGMYLSPTSVSNVYNSTIAFNGVYLSGGTVNLWSTIVSNSAGFDLYSSPTVSTTIGGAANLVMKPNIPAYPSNFFSSKADPKLGPLQNNGGPTLTRMPSTGSPAIGAGNNNFGSTYDQRGLLYPRTTGAGKSVDIGAIQYDTIFADGFEGGP
jgi:hypothetical protein